MYYSRACLLDSSNSLPSVTLLLEPDALDCTEVSDALLLKSRRQPFPLSRHTPRTRIP